MTCGKTNCITFSEHIILTIILRHYFIFVLSFAIVDLVAFYSARNARIASAVLAIAIPSVRLSVRLSLRLSHAGIVSKRRHVARCSLHRWIAKCV